MGWTIENNGKLTREELKERIKKIFKDGVATKVSIRHNQAYVLHKNKTISVVLFSNTKKEFSYKVIHETYHPFYYDCPIKYLSHDVGNKEWRDIVINEYRRVSDARRKTKIGKHVL